MSASTYARYGRLGRLGRPGRGARGTAGAVGSMAGRAVAASRIGEHQHRLDRLPGDVVVRRAGDLLERHVPHQPVDGEAVVHEEIDQPRDELLRGAVALDGADRDTARDE